ncbi:hypothetical protein niasHS_015828 [Heterodera schachtii]|uniref:Uncharacterized protein n=1 Tax=Heterodera schachtii TaxID=97005 RepID=A0ABD2HWN1_HETSC
MPDEQALGQLASKELKPTLDLVGKTDISLKFVDVQQQKQQPTNRWGITNSHSELVMFKPYNLVAQHRRNKSCK